MSQANRDTSTLIVNNPLTLLQEAWDQYMQPSNLTLDPAANLWSTTSPNNNLFTQTSSPDNTTGESSFGMPSSGSSFYPQNIGSVMSASTPDLNSLKNEGGGQQMPNLSANSTTVNNDNSAGEVFMGVQSPQPGGVPSWKWTIMGDQKK